MLLLMGDCVKKPTCFFFATKKLQHQAGTGIVVNGWNLRILSFKKLALRLHFESDKDI